MTHLATDAIFLFACFVVEAAVSHLLFAPQPKSEETNSRTEPLQQQNAETLLSMLAEELDFENDSSGSFASSSDPSTQPDGQYEEECTTTETQQQQQLPADGRGHADEPNVDCEEGAVEYDEFDGLDTASTITLQNNDSVVLLQTTTVVVVVESGSSTSEPPVPSRDEDAPLTAGPLSSRSDWYSSPLLGPQSAASNSSSSGRTGDLSSSSSGLPSPSLGAASRRKTPHKLVGSDSFSSQQAVSAAAAPAVVQHNGPRQLLQQPLHTVHATSPPQPSPQQQVRSAESVDLPWLENMMQQQKQQKKKQKRSKTPVVVMGPVSCEPQQISRRIGSRFLEDSATMSPRMQVVSILEPSQSSSSLVVVQTEHSSLDSSNENGSCKGTGSSEGGEGGATQLPQNVSSNQERTRAVPIELTTTTTTTTTIQNASAQNPLNASTNHTNFNPNSPSKALFPVTTTTITATTMSTTGMGCCASTSSAFAKIIGSPTSNRSATPPAATDWRSSFEERYEAEVLTASQIPSRIFDGSYATLFIDFRHQLPAAASSCRSPRYSGEDDDVRQRNDCFTSQRSNAYTQQQRRRRRRRERTVPVYLDSTERQGPLRPSARLVCTPALLLRPVPPTMVVFDLDLTLLKAPLASLQPGQLLTDKLRRETFVDAPFLRAFTKLCSRLGHPTGIASFTEGGVTKPDGRVQSSSDSVIDLLNAVLPSPRAYLSSVLHVVCQPRERDATKGKQPHIEQLVYHMDAIAVGVDVAQRRARGRAEAAFALRASGAANDIREDCRVFSPLSQQQYRLNSGAGEGGGAVISLVTSFTENPQNNGSGIATTAPQRSPVQQGGLPVSLSASPLFDPQAPLPLPAHQQPQPQHRLVTPNRPLSPGFAEVDDMFSESNFGHSFRDRNLNPSSYYYHHNSNPTTTTQQHAAAAQQHTFPNNWHSMSRTTSGSGLTANRFMMSLAGAAGSASHLEEEQQQEPTGMPLESPSTSNLAAVLGPQRSSSVNDMNTSFPSQTHLNARNSVCVPAGVSSSSTLVTVSTFVSTSVSPQQALPPPVVTTTVTPPPTPAPPPPPPPVGRPCNGAVADHSKLPVVLIDDCAQNCQHTGSGVTGFQCPEGLTRTWYGQELDLQARLGIPMWAVVLQMELDGGGDEVDDGDAE